MAGGEGSFPGLLAASMCGDGMGISSLMSLLLMLLHMSLEFYDLTKPNNLLIRPSPNTRHIKLSRSHMNSGGLLNLQYHEVFNHHFYSVALIKVCMAWK